MLSFVFAACVFVASFALYWRETRRRRRQEFARKNGFAFDPNRFDVTGELMGLWFRLSDDRQDETLARQGVARPRGSVPVAVVVPVPGCPRGLWLRSVPPKLASRLGGALEVATSHGQLDSAFTAGASKIGEIDVLEHRAVRAALMALASTEWYRSVVIEKGRLKVIHFDPALPTGREADELERTVSLALRAAAALRAASAARRRRSTPATRRAA